MTLYWTNTAYTIIAFLLLMWLLNKYAFGPLFAVMEKRRQIIQEQMNAAASSQVQAEAAMVEQKAALDEARKEAYSILEQARVTSSKQAEEMVSSAKNESIRLKDEALKDIESEKNKAISALRTEVGGISVQIASKIIEKQVDEKSQKEIVNKYLDKVGSK